MIYIKEYCRQGENIIPLAEVSIGVENNNCAEERVFVFPRMFKSLDLHEEGFAFVLQIEPVDQMEKPYFQLLEKKIDGENIKLIWKITRTNTKNSGILKASILIQNKTKDIVWQSNKFFFEVENGINAEDEIKDIPSSIYSQAVAESVLSAQSAKIEADRAFDIAMLVKSMYDEIMAIYKAGDLNG